MDSREIFRALRMLKISFVYYITTEESCNAFTCNAFTCNVVTNLKIVRNISIESTIDKYIIGSNTDHLLAGS